MEQTTSSSSPSAAVTNGSGGDVNATTTRDGTTAQQTTVAAASYHSPSDNILSPTSKKLGEIKGKRFTSGKPLSLFAKTVRNEELKSQERLLERTT